MATTDCLQNLASQHAQIISVFNLNHDVQALHKAEAPPILHTRASLVTVKPKFQSEPLQQPKKLAVAGQGSEDWKTYQEIGFCGWA